MHCSHAEHLLSLNLDGRLSTGQRQLLSKHIAECARCHATDRELVAARELALSLPVQPVSSEFREELWQRIRAGEGTPEAVFREPVPFATKVRYFATGAAAAAALLVAANLLRPGRGDSEAQTGASVAQTSREPGRKLRRVSPEDVAEGFDSAASLASFVPATPNSLADLVTNGYADAVRTLHEKAQDLDDRKVTPEMLDKLRDDAERARSFAAMVRWLVDGKYMYLPPDEAKSLTAIELVGEQVCSFRDADSLRRVLRPIRSLPLEQTTNYFCNPCVKDAHRFNQEFLVRLQDTRLDRTFGTTLELVRVPTPNGGEMFQILLRR
ncbi:MAG: zf-HC2 domain-containing protein [Planctomycetota bacterium]